MALEDTLYAQDTAGFIIQLRAIFAGIPYQIHLPYEAYYHSVAYLVLRLLGFTVSAERSTNLGRMDAALELPDLVYIIEFKFVDDDALSTDDTNDAGDEVGADDEVNAAAKPTLAELAIQQIKEQGYDVPFQGSGKQIILLGIIVGKESRNVVEWAQQRSSA